MSPTSGTKLGPYEIVGVLGTGGSKPEFSAPKEPTSIPEGLDGISLMADGKRILATRPVGQHSASPLGLVLNWQHLVQ